MLFFVHNDSFNTFDKHLFTGISMVICKIAWSIRSWLSDYISFSFYKSYCRHDIYWILVAFMIAASALIKVSRLYGLYRHLHTQLIYWHCAVILYTHANLLNKRFWILNPEKIYEFKSLRPSDAYMRQRTIPTLVQIMACHLVGTKPLSEPLLEYY